VTEARGELNPQAMADDTAALHAFLATREVGCPNCNYNLRGVSTPSCPECGLLLRLTVNLVEPKMWAYIAGIVCLSGVAFMSFTFELLLFVDDGLEGMMFGLNPFVIRRDQEKVAFLSAVSLLVCLPALVCWVRARSRLRRLDPSITRLLLAACVAAPILYVVLLLAWGLR